MRVLVACETSGAIRQRMIEAGHDCISCDILPADDNSPYHYQGDVFDMLDQEWDLIIMHPPCTALSLSGNGNDFFDVQEKMAAALEHVRGGKGPVSLEFATQRYFGHFEGDPQRYRAKGEVEQARESVDCLLQFQAHDNASVLSEDDFASIDTQVLELMDKIVATAKGAEVPKAEDVLTDVYASY